MEIVGYNNEDIFTEHLKEATITCTYDELKEITAFLDDIIKRYDSDNSNICLHFRDYIEKWDKSNSDLIVLIP